MVSSALYRRAIPSAARITSWIGPDGWRFRRFDWPCDAAGLRGRILWQGGRGDIFEKYLELFAHWHAQGWSITSLDWRGQGGSGRVSADPHVGDIDDFATYVDDFAAFWAVWSAEEAGPRVMMGHSMGGHLLARAITESACSGGGTAMPDAVVLIAPMMGVRSPFGAILGEAIARIIGGIGNPSRAAWKTNEKPATMATRQKLLTHDADRYGDELWWQSAQPELMLGPPSWRWVIEAFASTRRLRGDPRLQKVTVPVLMLVALADQLVLPSAAIAVADQLPDVQLVKFGREAAHEILREADPVRNRAIADIDAFLSVRVRVA